MANSEDPATVLEQWIHDSANLPAELSHLLEEMQAKDEQVQICRSVISNRDNSLQKFIRLNGGLVKNPKEEPYSKVVLQNFDKAQMLQDEKITLSERAMSLVDRHIKRLDIKLRDLQNDGTMAFDPMLPSLLRESKANLVPPTSSTTTGTNTPLHPLSGNTAGGSASIAVAAIARINQAARLSSPGAVGLQPHQLLAHTQAANAQPNAQMSRASREVSVGNDAKKRRLNASLGALPIVTSNLRQSSLGPGTPKASTPGSRAGSVGPRPMKKTMKKAPHQQLRKKFGRGLQKKRTRVPGARASPSTTADDDSVVSGEGTDDENGSLEVEGGEGEPMEQDDEDNTKYCFCQKVSYGNMVACDNDECKYQWFHWDCVGLKEEPEGEWLCSECTANLQGKRGKKGR